MRYAFQVCAAVLALLVSAVASLRAENTIAQPEPNSVSNDVRVDACSSDPKLLGLSRIVEIDATGGPSFGGGHGKDTDFLKDHEVVLTFDDGPLRTYTRPVLKALAAHCTKATFFMVGRMAAADPAMVKEVARAGHTIASHTWSHQNLRIIGLLKARQEFELGLAAVNKALGQPPAPFFRFPYLSGSLLMEEHLRRRNVSAIWIDVDSKDYQTRDKALAHRRIMDQLAVTHKGIILMHDIQPSTAGGIMSLLDDLHDKGYKVVHIVPKSSVDTVASYQTTVDKAFASKAESKAKNPIADRSIVWTMSPSSTGAAGASAAPAAAAKQSGSEASPSKQVSITAEGAEILPWQGSPAKKEPAATAVPKPKKATRAPPAEELPWQAKAFGY